MFGELPAPPPSHKKPGLPVLVHFTAAQRWPVSEWSQTLASRRFYRLSGNEWVAWSLTSLFSHKIPECSFCKKVRCLLVLLMSVSLLSLVPFSTARHMARDNCGWANQYVWRNQVPVASIYKILNITKQLTMINNKYQFVLKHNFVPVVVLDILPPPIVLISSRK